MKIKKEFLAWVCVLISSDGSVDKQGKITFYSSEKDWVKIIQSILKDNGFDSTVDIKYPEGSHKGSRVMYRIYLKNSRAIWQAIKNKKLQIFIMPRKWQRLDNHFSKIRNYFFWSPEKIEFLKKNIIKTKYKDLAKQLGTTESAIAQRVFRSGISNLQRGIRQMQGIDSRWGQK